MARLKERNTGSLVNVPDEDAAAVLALGYYEPADKKATPAKSTTSKVAKK